MLCQGQRVGLLQLQFQQALLALPGMEGWAVAVPAAVFADPGCSGAEREFKGWHRPFCCGFYGGEGGWPGHLGAASFAGN